MSDGMDLYDKQGNRMTLDEYLAKPLPCMLPHPKVVTTRCPCASCHARRLLQGTTDE